jgi:phosphatidylethanolamine/phosphatidyl-N-methylethanolamine N-methyltransferase
VKKWDWLRAETATTLENQQSRRCLSQFFHSLGAKDDSVGRFFRRETVELEWNKVNVMTETCKSNFQWEFVRHPGTVGAIAASSSSLAREMVQGFDWQRIRTVVEYGPGTGAFTGEILARLQPGARYAAIEINPQFVQHLRAKYPGVAIHQNSAVDVASVCAAEEFTSLDAIVCGLPWASFSDSLQTAILDPMIAMLEPDGQFATFAYLQGLLLPGGIKMRRRLRRCFASVESSRVVWRNLPPAFVYRCRHPQVEDRRRNK